MSRCNSGLAVALKSQSWPDNPSSTVLSGNCITKSYPSCVHRQQLTSWQSIAKQQPICFLGFEFVGSQGTKIEYGFRPYNLLSYLQTISSSQVPRVRLQLVIKIISHLQILHQNGICHTNLRADNVLIEANQSVLLSECGVKCRLKYCAQSRNIWYSEQQKITKIATVLTDIRHLGILIIQTLTPPSLIITTEDSLQNSISQKHQVQVNWRLQQIAVQCISKKLQSLGQIRNSILSLYQSYRQNNIIIGRNNLHFDLPYKNTSTRRQDQVGSLSSEVENQIKKGNLQIALSRLPSLDDRYMSLSYFLQALVHYRIFDCMDPQNKYKILEKARLLADSALGCSPNMMNWGCRSIQQCYKLRAYISLKEESKNYKTITNDLKRALMRDGIDKTVDYELLYNYGTILLSSLNQTVQEVTGQGIQALEKIPQSHPLYKSSQLNIIAALIQVRSFKKAYQKVEHLEKRKSKDMAFLKYYKALVVLNENTDDSLRKARLLLEDEEVKLSNHTQSQLLLAHISLINHDLESAKLQLRLLGSSSGNQYLYHHFSAILKMYNKDSTNRSEIETHFHQALQNARNNEDQALVYFNKAYLYFDPKDLRNCHELTTKALISLPNHQKIHRYHNLVKQKMTTFNQKS